MKISIENLNYILETIEKEKFITFMENYLNEMRFNPFLPKHTHERIFHKPFEAIKDEPDFTQFIIENETFFSILDTFKKETKKEFETALNTLYLLYQDIEDPKDYLNKTTILSQLQIDTVIFGYNYHKKYPISILDKNNKRVYFKPNESLLVFSDGFITNPKLYAKQKNEDEIIGCLFDIKDATFILEKENSNQNAKKTLYLLGSNLDVEEIQNEPINNDLQFEKSIKYILEAAKSIPYNHDIKIDYPPLEGKKPICLYHR